MTTRLQPQSQTLTVNGLRVHSLDWGNAGAPSVVCVHGFASSAQAFNALARHFAPRFHILVPDVRGHGDSAWSPTEAYHCSDRVGDLAAFVDQLRLAQLTLIGTSMGGRIAMAYAREHPERLVRLVINDIGPDVEGGLQRITQRLDTRPEAFATLDDAIAYRRQVSVIRRSAEDERGLARGVLRQGPDGQWVRKMDPAYIRQRRQPGGRPQPALWPVLEHLPCPTLVVWGTESDILSEAQARRMVDVLPQGELVAVPGVGHAPTLVEPVVLAALERFLSGLS